MENSQKQIGKLLTALGLGINVLPFLGSYRKWQFLLMQVCKESRELWEGYENEFKRLHKLIKWTGHDQEIEYLLELGGNNNFGFDKDLKIAIECTNKKHFEFIEKASELVFGSFSSLSIRRLNKRHKHKSKMINRFICNTTPNLSDEFAIVGLDKKYFPVDPYIKGIQSLKFSPVRHVTISDFTINNESMQIILENCSLVKNLEIFNCKVDLTKDFELSSQIIWQIDELILYKTTREDDDEFMDTEKFIIFLKAIEKAGLLKSLSILKIDKRLFSPYRAEEILEELNISIEIM